MMPDMIDNICNYRSTDQAVVEAPDFTSTSYRPPNSREGDKIVCVAPVTPPHKKPPPSGPQRRPRSPSPTPRRSRSHNRRSSKLLSSLPPLLSPPHKRPPSVPSLPDYEVDSSKKVVANPLYPPSTSSITTTPSTVNISSNSCTPSNTLDDSSLDNFVFAPNRALGYNSMGGKLPAPRWLTHVILSVSLRSMMRV